MKGGIHYEFSDCTDEVGEKWYIKLIFLKLYLTGRNNTESIRTTIICSGIKFCNSSQYWLKNIIADINIYNINKTFVFTVVKLLDYCKSLVANYKCLPSLLIKNTDTLETKTKFLELKK